MLGRTGGRLIRDLECLNRRRYRSHSPLECFLSSPSPSLYLGLDGLLLIGCYNLVPVFVGFGLGFGL